MFNNLFTKFFLIKIFSSRVLTCKRINYFFILQQICKTMKNVKFSKSIKLNNKLMKWLREAYKIPHSSDDEMDCAVESVS